MARFTDGPAHQRRRELVQSLLPDPARLERDAWSMTSAGLAGRRGRWDAMELARQVPCAVLAASLGTAPETIGAAAETADVVPGAADVVPRAADVVPRAASSVADLTGQLCAVLAPRSAAGLASGDTPANDGDAAETARYLETPLGLVGLAERGDPPVQCTRRVAARPVTIGGVTIPAGALVWVLLATADRGDPWPPATFGGGPHACPARMAATALARGVVGAILDGGWRPVPGQPVGYEPRPNLRIPVSVLLERS